MCSKRVLDICQLDMGCMEGLALSKQKIHTASPMVVCNILWIEDMLEMIRNSWLWLTHIKRCRNRFVLARNFRSCGWFVFLACGFSLAVWPGGLKCVYWVNVSYILGKISTSASHTTDMTHSRIFQSQLSKFVLISNWFPGSFFRCHWNHSHEPNFPLSLSPVEVKCATLSISFPSSVAVDSGESDNKPWAEFTNRIRMGTEFGLGQEV